jgi:methylmalonyl-CoA mutase C-terminal domain/subunit
MPIRVLVAKPGLDGHDRGAKVVARILRDAGYEVIYTGIRQRPEEIAAAAVQEDVDVIGLSVLSGAHLGLTRKVLSALADRNAEDITVVVGGTIPGRDHAKLRELGAAAVFPTGTVSTDIVRGIEVACAKGREDQEGTHA